MSSVKWSSPVRLAGSTPLTPIPNEIYLEIFDYFTPSDDEVTKAECKRVLSNLALVCRFFCAMALPRIFKSLEFSGSMCNESTKPGYASFCRAVIKGLEPAASLSRHVEKCTFEKWRVDTERLRWVYNGFLGMYGQALGRMPNLQSVVLTMVDVDKRLLKTISGLTNLQSLSVNLCTFMEDITDTVIRKLTPLKLRSFSCTDLQNKALLAKTLARIVSTSNLKDLRVSGWTVARDILAQFDKESSLVELEVYGARDDPILWKVLELSKAMKNIRIDRLPGAPWPSNILSSSSMPQLRTLVAPPSLALALVPGRPLHTVLISGDPYHCSVGRAEIERLKHSTISIKVLQIPIDFYFLAPFDEFPQMEVLRLYYHQPLPDGRGWLEDEMCKVAQKWRSTLPIREFYFDFRSFELHFRLDLELHHKIIVYHLADAFPSANIIGLGGYVHWHKNRHTRSWTPTIPVDKRSTVGGLIQSGIASMVCDYNGCLEAVLSSPKGLACD